MQKIHDERAQGVVEFALIATVLMFVFLGTVDYARFLYYDTAIRSAARVGAEVAGNHCTPVCGGLPVTTDDFIVQATVCEANINLQPQPASNVGCGGCVTLAGSPANCSDPYNTTTDYRNTPEPSLSQDVYVSPSCPPKSVNPCATSGAVAVYVGYNFTPVTPLMGQFFPVKACYPNDPSSNHHTLCTVSLGKLSTQ